MTQRHLCHRHVIPFGLLFSRQSSSKYVVPSTYTSEMLSCKEYRPTPTIPQTTPSHVFMYIQLLIRVSRAAPIFDPGISIRRRGGREEESGVRASV
jgi:hypothetical protein